MVIVNLVFFNLMVNNYMVCKAKNTFLVFTTNCSRVSKSLVFFLGEAGSR